MTSYLDLLPNEIILKILDYLRADLKSYLNFTNCQKRLLHLSNQPVISKTENIRQPLTFNFASGRSITCHHGTCFDEHIRQTNEYDYHSNCNRILKHLVGARFRQYNGLEFKFINSVGAPKVLDDTFVNPCNVIDLEFSNCLLNLKWIDVMLFNLKHLGHLSLNSVSLVAKSDDSYLVQEARTLNQFTMINRDFEIVDETFMYFVDKIVPIKLNISGTKIEYHPRVVMRFYPDVGNGEDAEMIDRILATPSNYILSYPLLRYYLRKNQGATKSLNLSKSGVSLETVVELLCDEKLKDMVIYIQDCPQILKEEVSELMSVLSERDLKRLRINLPGYSC